MFPEYGEEGALEAVGDDSRFEAAAEETGVSVFVDDEFGGLEVGERESGSLFGGFNDAE